MHVLRPLRRTRCVRQAVHALLRARSGDAAYWMVNIARGIEQLDRIRFEAINPMFLLAAT